MDEKEILQKFEGIQNQLARERRARLHAWVPRSLVIAAFAVFAVVWVQGLDVSNQQEKDRQARRVEICEAINENRDLVSDFAKDLVVVAKAQDDPEIQALFEKYENRLALEDCTDPFVPDSGN